MKIKNDVSEKSFYFDINISLQEIVRFYFDINISLRFDFERSVAISTYPSKKLFWVPSELTHIINNIT